MSDLKVGDKVTWGGKPFEVKALIADKRRPAAMLESPATRIRVHNISVADLAHEPKGK